MSVDVSYSYINSLDDVCYLVSYESKKDDIGNQIKTPVETLCYCSKTSTSANEYFKARQQGLKPSLKLAVDTLSYDGETQVKYEDDMYDVYRVYGRADGITELYLTQSR